jgi:hypothetical protein
LIDFVVFDDVISYELVSAPRIGREAGTIIANTRLVLRPHRVTDRIHGFKELWAAAKPFQGTVPPSPPTQDGTGPTP